MTNPYPIDAEKLLTDQLATVSPDLLRGLLSTFIHTLLGAEADAVWRRIRRAQRAAVQSPQRVSASGFRHPRRHHRRGRSQAAARELFPGLAVGPP